MGTQNPFRLSAAPFERPEQKTAEAKAVLFVSTERTETEPDYFHHLNASLKRDAPFVIRVLRHSRDTDSDPRHVLDLLEECRAIRSGKPFFDRKTTSKELRLTKNRIRKVFENWDSLSDAERETFRTAVARLGIDVDYYRYLQQIGGSGNDRKDRFAIVIDRDGKCHDLKTLEEIRDICRERGFDFCLSNPCFDLWLLLHLECRLTPQRKRKLLQNNRTSRNNTESGVLLSALAHHSKNITKAVFERTYLPKIRHACKRAAGLATEDGEILHAVGTRAPVIVAPLLEWL